MTGGFDSTQAVHNAPLVFVAILYFAIYLVIRFMTRIRATPDPWDAETAKALEHPEALPVCHRCFTPQDHQGWFCPECGAATGRYNNYLPYVRVFSEGEILRAGTTDRLRPSFVVVGGYLLWSLSMYFVFAPLYWYFLFRNIREHQREAPIG